MSIWRASRLRKPGDALQVWRALTVRQRSIGRIRRGGVLALSAPARTGARLAIDSPDDSAALRDLRTARASYARHMRKFLLITLVFGIVLAARATPACADVGVGLFLGEPTGVDLKIGLGNRSALDLLLGFDTLRAGRGGYGHLTYLVTPLVAQGSSVLVPLRLGIGAAVYGSTNDTNLAVRAPLELALRLRSSPLEFYGELAFELTLIDPASIGLQGGGGFRVFF
jgi:hypothetical protein